MRIRPALLTTIVATSFLTACTSYRGPNRLDTAGKPDAALAATYGIRGLFSSDLSKAITARSKQSVTAADMRPLLNSGFALVRLSCNEYFNEMGRNQRNSAVLRDLIKPLTDVVNVVIGLKLLSDVENINADLLTGWTAFSSTGAAALSIYDRHFLFDNDNIAAVRAMTMNALATHRKEVYEATPDDVVLAIGQLQDNENICTPAQILSNVREAIKKGDFEAKTAGAGAGAAPETAPPPPPPPGAVPQGSESHTVSPGS